MIQTIIPKSFKKFLRDKAKEKYSLKDASEYYSDFLKERVKEEKQIPKVNLEQKHIQHLEVLINRKELLKKLPKAAVCSELGVNEGEFSQQILSITEPAKLHLIDAWGNATRYHDGLKLLVAEKLDKEIKAGVVEINVGFSTEVLSTIPDKYFDWVYLDTDHSYHVTANELHILKDKVKEDGIIAGHDYIIGNWEGNCRYGVIEAVHELCVKDNWELIYTTINNSEMPSFAIRRIR